MARLIDMTMAAAATTGFVVGILAWLAVLSVTMVNTLTKAVLVTVIAGSKTGAHVAWQSLDAY